MVSAGPLGYSSWERHHHTGLVPALTGDPQQCWPISDYWSQPVADGDGDGDFEAEVDGDGNLDGEGDNDVWTGDT